jgi:hypothetical protein
MLFGLSATQAADAPDISKLMTAEDYAASGLDKLSAEERAQLSEWVARYREGAIAGPPAERTPEQREEAQKVEDKEDKIGIVANVIPKFTGWSGKTIFRLDNGQIWKQRMSGSMRYSGDDYSVVISRNFIGKYTMKHVETGRSIGVQRLQ